LKQYILFEKLKKSFQGANSHWEVRADGKREAKANGKKKTRNYQP
jgi:hypothetical protein